MWFARIPPDHINEKAHIMHLRILTLASLAMLGANVARATTYINTIGAAGTFSTGADGLPDDSSLLASSFYVSGTPDFNSLTLALSATAPGDGGSVMVFLLPDDGTGGPGVAGFPDLSGVTYPTLGTISDSALVASPTLVTFAISAANVSSITSPNGEYWIGLSTNEPTSVQWAQSSVGNGIGLDGQSGYALNNFNGGALFAGGYQMTVSAENVPEPTTVAILGGGLAGIGYVRRRRAKQA
jgi:hypothetical protein